MTTAVLLMALGGPDSLDAVGPYLADLRGGRPTPPELVAEIAARYAATGGRSPVYGITTELAGKLEARLGGGTRCFVGLRHTRPRIEDVWGSVVASGPEDVVAICLAPQDSEMTVGKYYERLDAGIATHGDLPLRRVRSWATHPGLVAALAGTVEAGLARFPEPQRGSVPVLFTAHSLPTRVLDTGDPYPGQVAATVDAVVASLDAGRAACGREPLRFRFAFQSQGRSAEPWLGPEVEATLDALAADGERNVCVAPVGFLSDHVEVSYDIDIEFAAHADKLGLRLERTPMLNATDPLVDTLADIVRPAGG